MPILLAVLAGFLLGVSFAWMARAELARVDAPLVATRPFNIVVGFVGLVYAPVLGYFVAFYGDWTYGYTVAWSRIPSAIDLALVLVACGSVFGGMAAASHAARSRRLDVVSWLGAVPAALFVASVAWGSGRLAVSATYAQYRGGFGVLPIGSSSLGRSVLAMGVVAGLGVAWTARAIARTEEEAASKAGRPSRF